MVRSSRVFRATILVGVLTGAFAALPVEAQSAPDASAQTDGYFVYGLVVLCGGLLVLLLHQSRRLRDMAGENRNAKRMVEFRDAVLSSDQAAALFFEPGSGAGLQKSSPRITPPLRRLLALAQTAEGTLDDIQAAFDEETGGLMQKRLDDLRATGAGFTEDLCTRDGNRTITASGERVSTQLDSTEPGGAEIDVVWFRDTSDQVDARRALAGEAGERRILEAVNGLLPMPVWRRDENQKLVYRNPAAEALVANDDPSLEVAKRAVRTGRGQMQSVYVVVAGDRKLFEFAEWPMPDGSGTVGWAFDVTVLEETQSNLARLVASHEEVLEELSTAIAVFGPDKRLRYFNTAFASLWMIEPAQLQDEPTVSEFLNLLRERRRLPEQSDFAAFRDQWNGMFTTLISPRQELLFLPDESTLRMVVAAHPNGGLLLTFEDVTDRLVLERSYNVLSAVQRETIDNLNDALAVFGSDGRLELLNPRFSALWELPVNLADSQPHMNDVLGLMEPHFSDQEDRLAFKEGFASKLSDRVGDSGRVERRDGAVLDYAMVPLSDGATLVEYRDVTDSIHIQRALQERAEALEQADRLKSKFIANVSYELRTPLNVIIGFSELLRMQVVGEMNTKQLDYAGSILASSNLLATLISDILDLASIEAGYMELDWMDVDVLAMMGDLQLLAQERSRAKDIVITVEVAPEAAVMRADPVRLKQALFNLISNALKFSNAGAEIELVARREDGATVLEVMDTGEGIPADLQRRIFETFQQGGRGGRSTGAGLGLALVERLIQLHGGEVAMTSRVDVGTTISCRIPDQAPIGLELAETAANPS